jgi:hypothetical protein
VADTALLVGNENSARAAMGGCGAEREMQSCCFAVGGEVGWRRRRTRVRFHLFLRTRVHVLTQAPRPSTGLLPYKAQWRDVE